MTVATGPRTPESVQNTVAEMELTTEAQLHTAELHSPTGPQSALNTVVYTPDSALETAAAMVSGLPTPEVSTLHTGENSSPHLQVGIQISISFSQVLVPYKGGPRKYNIKTPSRKSAIKRLARKTYKATATTMLSTPLMSQPILLQLALKIRNEMKEISSTSYDSILRDTVEAVKNFSWETVRLELLQKVPTLMTILSHLIGKSPKQHPLLCLIGSMILKSRHQHMGLVQRAMSVMMYGYGTSKQVSELSKWNNTSMCVHW